MTLPWRQLHLQILPRWSHHWGGALSALLYPGGQGSLRPAGCHSGPLEGSYHLAVVVAAAVASAAGGGDEALLHVCEHKMTVNTLIYVKKTNKLCSQSDAYGHYYCFCDMTWCGLTRRHSAITIWHCAKNGFESLYFDNNVSGWLVASSYRTDIITVLPAMTLHSSRRPRCQQAAGAHWCWDTGIDIGLYWRLTKNRLPLSSGKKTASQIYNVADGVMLFM